MNPLTRVIPVIRFFSVCLPLIVAGGCASSKPPSEAPQAASPRTPERTATPAPVAPDATSAGEARELEQRRNLEAFQKGLLAKRGESDSLPGESEELRGDVETVFDPVSGKKLNRIPKSPLLYVVRGRLYNSIVKVGGGLPLVREDEKAYYVEAPAERKPPEPSGSAGQAAPKEPQAPSPVIEVAAEEAEIVTPLISETRLSLEEMSDGLPVSGIWRDNFTLGDLDGDRRLEIIAPPPRLSADPLRIFRLDQGRWRSVDAVFEDPEGVGFGYGGVVAADLNRDGRTDLAYAFHGHGPAAAYNEGSFRFRIQNIGQAKAMSVRGLDVGDLDGDGNLDVVALSDEPEYVKRRAAGKDAALAQMPRDGYVPFYDVRAFFARGQAYEENHDGLGEACFGFTIGVAAPAADNGEPFIATSCRYMAGTFVIYGYDKANARFHRVGLDFAERYSLHTGTAIGLFKGLPAAYMSYAKFGPAGASLDITSYGVSIYYREKGIWKRSRLMKAKAGRSRIESQGLAVGDLDGDGLMDVAFADNAVNRIRIFFQGRVGEFKELEQSLEPTFLNEASSVRIGDVDGDGQNDIILMYHFGAGAESRAGGLRVFRNRGVVKP